MPPMTKEEIREYQKAYYEANKEAILEKRKAYYEANKEVIAEKKKAWYEANKEYIDGYKKAWYEANKEAILEKRKAYRGANKEAIAEKSRAYRETNKEAILEKKKAYRETNKEAILEKQKAYYEANKADALAKAAKRRALKRKAVPKFLRNCEEEKSRLRSIYKLRQVISDATGIEHHVDHMWPLSDGGPHWSGNLQIITAQENLSKYASVCEETKAVIKESLEETLREYTCIQS
jgi:hypothetical protein